MPLTKEEIAIIQEALDAKMQGLRRVAGKEKNDVVKNIRMADADNIGQLILKLGNKDLFQ